MSSRSLVSIILAFLIPGAGHFYLGKHRRALAYFIIIVFLFAVGLMVDGNLYTLAESRRALLGVLATFGSMGSGLLYFIAKMFGPYGSVMSPTFEYGRMFTLSAGLMNLLLMVDCYDIGEKRKD